MQMRRTILFATILLTTVAAMAQTPLSFGNMNTGLPAFRHFNQATDTTPLQKKWFLTKHLGLSSGFFAFNGGSGSFLSAPIGLQLNRQLTNNIYAFAGVAAVPAYIHFNSPFLQPGINKPTGFMNANSFSTYTMAQMGLMYVNDEKTFSISGSIGVGRRNYNGYSPFYAPVATPSTIKNSRQ